MSVNDGLTPKRHFLDASTIQRMLRAYTRAVGDGDPADLAELVEIDAQLHDLITATVQHMHYEQQFTWDTIGQATGTSRQAAHKKWGRR